MSEEPLNLPALPGDGEVEPMIFDGEIVEEGAAAAATPAAAAPAIPVPPWARFALRHGGRIAIGAWVLILRWHRKRTRHERMMRGAEAAGNYEAVVALRKQQEDERHHRREGRVKLLGAIVAVAMASVWIAGSLLGVPLVLGFLLAIANRNAHDLFAPLLDVARAVQLLFEVAAVVWGIGIPLAFAGAVAGLWWLGGHAGDLAPAWSLSPKQLSEDRGLVVTADSVVVAMQHTPVSELKKAFADKVSPWRPVFHTLPVKDGEGYFAVFSVPMGVTPGMLADQVEVFARNLHRAKCEVWITDAERAKVAPAGYAALWAANPGVLDRDAPEYPLLHDGQADVFEGVPGGVLARGDGALIPVVANNLVVGGQMGQGKSNGCRVYILGCCTDPLCEVSVFVFANNGDFDAYAPRLESYVKGTGDDVAAAAVNHLHGLLEEVDRREGRLAELGAKKLTRRIAEIHPDMRPKVVLFSECHELFGHPEYGEIAAELAVKVIKRARKTGITMVFDTQSSRKGAIPPALVELVSVNGCFYVKTWRSNDGFLGDGSFQAGIRATELRPGRDRGRSLITGISDAQFELLKWYLIFVDDDTGYDDATEVIARCMQNLAPGTRVSGGDGASLPVLDSRNLLADVAMVIDGPARVMVNDLPVRLRKLAPAWPEYRKLTGRELRARLALEGVKTTNTDNKPELDPAELQRAIAARELDE
jgi:S-DNA-T family DNA segregation ATPase FtsK/SpoIIIE